MIGIQNLVLISIITSGPAGPSCVKGVDHCSTVMVNFRSLPNPYLLTYRDKNWPQWLRLATHKDCQVWCKSDQRWRPHVCVKYTPGVTFFPFFLLFFLFSVTHPDQTRRPICTQNGSKDADWRKDDPFYGLGCKKQRGEAIWTVKPPKFGRE